MGRPKGRISKIRFLKAIPGTCGIKIRIAETLDCSYNTLNRYLNKEGWDDVRQVYKDECEKIKDLAEETVHHCIEQRGGHKELAVASKNARWLLGRRAKERGYGEETTVKHEGGEEPIKVEQSQKISIEDLDLPIETRKLILEAMKKKKAQEGGLDEQG